MSGDDEGGRRYSDEECALILRRASEISEVGDARPGGGLSLSEIQQIAGEAGIDPTAVARAAAGLPESSHDRLVAFFGGPARYRHERTLPGKVSEEAQSRILQAIRRAAGHQGTTEHVLDSLEWQTIEEPSQIFVNVSARDTGTTIEVLGDRRTAYALTYFIPTFAALLGSLILVAKVIEPTTALGVGVAGIFGSAFIVARTIWSRTSVAFRRKLGAIMDEASRTAEKALEEGGSEPAALDPGQDEGGSSGE